MSSCLPIACYASDLFSPVQASSLNHFSAPKSRISSKGAAPHSGSTFLSFTTAQSMDDDAGSLFGSPPPTPTRGRSPSPSLALPGASACILNFNGSSAQNVGTIALPGSHHLSELPVNPLALSLSYPPCNGGDAFRPPAQERGGFVTQVRLKAPAPAPPSVLAPPCPSLASRKKPTKKPKAKPKASARPAPPPIHLPDPSHPLPPNLLRNQPGLLGTAGVVAGVRAAHLPARSSPTESTAQGMSSANPIFVDDLPQPPRISKHVLPAVDLTRLPPPSNQDIITTLIRQGDIFPVLENIIKLISSDGSHRSVPSFSTRGQSRASSDAGSRSQTPSDDTSSARKRRKLNRVPAGAELWDVPYPFKEGEGPAAYQNNWEKNRGKRLIAELVGLIKDAAKTAAVKNQVEKAPNVAELATISKHYRVETLFYGPRPLKPAETEVLVDTSNSSRLKVTSPTDPSPPSTPPSTPSSAISIPFDSPTPTPFDRLIASLLSASADSSSSNIGDDFAAGLFDTGPLDQGLLDSWMDIIQTFPVPAEGFTPDHRNEPYTGELSMLLNPAQDPQSSLMSFDMSSFPHAFLDMPSSEQKYDPLFGDTSAIDPILLGLGPIDTTSSASMSNFSDSVCPSLSGSPIPSISSYSFGDYSPMTPTDGGWDGDVGIGVYSPGEEHRFVGPSATAPSPVMDNGKGKKRDLSELKGWSDAEIQALSFLDTVSKTTSKPKPKSKGKEKARADEDGGQDAEVNEGQPPDFSTLPTLPIRGHLVRADVLRRAKERKNQLTLEIARTRIALWETTIEGGVLAGLVKYYSKT